MFDIEKLISSILAFVNFFTVRIAVTYVSINILYFMTGRYYFDLAMGYINSRSLTESSVTAYIGLAGQYVTEDNIKNALFVIAIFVSLSVLDIVYRIVVSLGQLLPVTIVYDSTYSTDQSFHSILKAWKYYGDKFQFFDFQNFVLGKVNEEKMWSGGWWMELYRYSRSFIVIVALVYLVTPDTALEVTFFRVVYLVALAAICMVVCTIIESARYADYMSYQLHRATLALTAEAKSPVLADAVVEEFRRSIETPEKTRLQSRSKFFCAKLTFYIPYFGRPAEWIRWGRLRLTSALQSWRAKRRKKRW